MGTITNDICMLRLEDSADLSSQYIGTIGLPSSGQEYPSGHMCTVSGWGTTSEGGALARILQKVDVLVVSDDDCRDSYGQNDIADSMICAGLDLAARTPARATLAVPSCAASVLTVLSAGDTAAL